MDYYSEGEIQNSDKEIEDEENCEELLNSTDTFELNSMLF